jgi:7-keto-8-aminopelargonate synthetase-like enzyme
LDLKKIVDLKLAYGAYLLLDDTYCIGVMGASGRGTVERCGVRIADIDCLIGSLEHAFGSVGGFCAGRSDIIEHQRLYGDGYCFSASAPACLTTAAYKAIEFLETDEGKTRLDNLQTNIERFTRGIANITCLSSLSSSASYVQIIKLPENCSAVDVFKTVESFKSQPVQVSPLGLQTLARYQPKNFASYISRLLRINISADMTASDIDVIVKELAAAVAPYDIANEQIVLRSKTPVIH